ncbi:class I SAM-dependent methyltransferase [Paenibacillus sp. tmac-D7]|uniref:class I SAM-dependent methyltransferase n=1 Tax=Paenibacillus sp. tmac-D7 TaxID=2591462 RepID=UPI001142B0EF|nr:class I SAM-dependent methyltransferase [Paenibacillus sp. tmac-D7]
MYDLSNLLKIVTNEELVIAKSPDFLLERQYYGTYADIPVEEELYLMEALKNRKWKEVVKDLFFEKSPWLYKIITDSGRAQFLNLLSIKKGGTFLDVGSGWGQVTIPLAIMGNSIAFDLTENRLEILRLIAVQEGKEVGCIQGNFLTFPFKSGTFDLVVFNGSLEWMASSRKNDESIHSVQMAALKKAYEILNQDGQVYIGIENSIGAKYLLGAEDDHTSIAQLTYLNEDAAENKHQSIAGRMLPAKTWSFNEYMKMFSEAGFSLEKAYGCYPDYKLIRLMIEVDEIDQYILKNRRFVEEYIGSNGELFHFNEELSNLYYSFAVNGISKFICPSYGFILRKRG